MPFMLFAEMRVSKGYTRVLEQHCWYFFVTFSLNTGCTAFNLFSFAILLDCRALDLV